jgi:16S rRNA processing protein RimM
MRDTEWVELGRIGSPFGIEGGLHIDSFTEPTEALFEYEVWSVRAASGQRTDHQVVEARPQGKRFVVYFDGIEDRDAAARLTGSMIEVRRNELPPVGDREHYAADLIGLRVTNLEGVELGTVQHFVNGTAQPVMLIKGTREHLVPAVPQHLKKVDLSAGTILVDWPEEFE